MSHKPCQICSKHLAHRGLKTCALTPLFFLRNFAHGNICIHIFGCKVTIVISFHCSVHNLRSYFSCKSTIFLWNQQENPRKFCRLRFIWYFCSGIINVHIDRYSSENHRNHRDRYHWFATNNEPTYLSVCHEVHIYI